VAHVNPILILPNEAADMLGVHSNTIRNWANAGIIHAYITPTGQRRFELDSIQNLRDQMSKGTQS